MRWLPLLFFALAGGLSSRLVALPAEIAITAPARLEILREGRVTGTVGLEIGTKLDLAEVSVPYALVRYRGVYGRVPLEKTDLPTPPAPPAPPPPPPIATVPPVSPTATTPPAPAAAAPSTPATPFERTLQGKLVRLAGASLQPVAPAQLEGVKFYAIYFSASWCGPCRQFTPELIDAYRKIRALYPEFEIVLVNRDRSAADMLAYIRSDSMPWPALAWDAIKEHPLNRYAGPGIPCLVLVDTQGKVLSDSFRFGRYVGPDAVLDATWKILRDYRRAHPRPRSGT